MTVDVYFLAFNFFIIFACISFFSLGSGSKEQPVHVPYTQSRREDPVHVPYYLANFEHILGCVIDITDDKELFNEEELDTVRAFRWVVHSESARNLKKKKSKILAQKYLSFCQKISCYFCLNFSCRYGFCEILFRRDLIILSQRES